jgi:hypothetical protein
MDERRVGGQAAWTLLERETREAQVTPGLHHGVGFNVVWISDLNLNLVNSLLEERARNVLPELTNSTTAGKISWTQAAENILEHILKKRRKIN